MSFHYPRRVRDLPTLDTDSEDDFITPQKKQKPQKETNWEKSPKRSSELPTLESDSEEDENVRDDNLNCAILNDSFIMSPTKSEQDESESLSTACKGNNHNDSATNEPSAPQATKGSDASNGNLSFILRFDKMALNSGGSGESNSAPKSSHSSVFSSSLPSIQEHQKIDSGGAAPVQRAKSEDMAQSQPQEQIPTKVEELETPFKSEIAGSETAATLEAQFATPQIRSFSLQRRPRDLCSTNSQKTRSAIVNEFRSQKVLFQTPMAISRVPLAMRLPPNDSIALSLCDTINESVVATPSTAEKVVEPNAEGGDAVSKSKKSLEDAFLEAQGKSNATKEEAAKSSTTSAAPTTSTTASSGKPTILRIKNADYAILQKLGCGGSSSVYLARREDNAEEFALKVVDLRGDPVVVEGYLNETKLLAKLQGNVCVVALYQYELLQKESKLYLVMEKGDSDLHKILQTYTTNLPLYVLTNFLYQMLQAVNYIHQNGVIHSDLKPANFLMVNRRLKLIDFGIASNIALDSTSIIKFSQAGTFNYISPEALTDTSTGSSPMRTNQPKIKISTKSDVWSLGCILYLLLYKKTPFSHIKNTYAKVTAIQSPTHPIEFPELPHYYPAMLVHMVKKCLQHNPKKRPSCAELLQYPFSMLIPIHNLTVQPK